MNEISINLLRVYEQVRDLHGDRHPTLLDCAKHHILEIAAAGFVHGNDGDACNVVETENVRQPDLNSGQQISGTRPLDRASWKPGYRYLSYFVFYKISRWLVSLPGG